MQISPGMVAVVTGAGSGIGRALAEKAAQSGMRVVAADIEQPRLDDTVASLEQLGAQAIGVRTDVSVEDDVMRLADAAYAEFGAVNLLCNNAGVFSGGLMWERTIADWKWAMGVNLDGLIHAVRAFVPRMLEAETPGHIVNTASMGGLVTGAYSGPYFTSKFAAVGLTECLAHDLRTTGKNVSASVLVPSLINTSIGTSGRNRQERWIDRGREATPDAEFVEAMLIESTAAGMAPAAVAELVFDAVAAGNFWIPTQPSYHDQIRARHDDMQELRHPAPAQLD
jgi:NAD(P)-dependent dehydrogenase (short-subunit alcohol dehydrogenase family)